MLPPKKFKTVKQPPGSRICGICVCAMAVGKGIRYVKNRVRTVRHQDGQEFIRIRELLKFIGSHGIYCGMYCCVEGETFGYITRRTILKFDSPFNLGPAILTVPSEVFDGAFHYVFWDGRHVRDPNPNFPDRVSVVNYDVKEILPLIYIDETTKWKSDEN